MSIAKDNFTYYTATKIKITRRTGIDKNLLMFDYPRAVFRMCQGPFW